MPELPEVETVRRRLQPVMEGARFRRVILRRDGLRRPFPHNFAGRLERRTVRALSRRGKFLLAELSSGETLVMHLGMSGSMRVGRDDGTKEGGDPADRHDHVVFRMSSGASVTFNDPRRFGVMDLVPRGQLSQYPALEAMGPEPLGPGAAPDPEPEPARERAAEAGAVSERGLDFHQSRFPAESEAAGRGLRAGRLASFDSF